MQKRAIVPALAFMVLAAACSEQEVLTDPGAANGANVPTREVQLLIETPADMSLLFEERANVIARVVFADNGNPVGQRPVSFALDGDTSGGSLAIQTAVTGADGRVSNVFTAGALRADLQIVVSTTQRDGSTLTEYADVIVDGVYRGGLRVGFDYSDVVPLPELQASLHEGVIDCENVNYGSLPPVQAEALTGDVNSTVFFEALEENKIFSVTVEAKGPAGNTVAYGCAVADPIAGRSVITMTVPLKLEMVDLEGSYDFSTTMHLNETLPGVAGTVVDEVGNFFHDPAELMLRYLGLALEQYVGLDPTYWDLGLMLAASTAGYNAGDFDSNEHMVAQFIYDNLLNRLPTWVDDGMSIGGDVTDLVNNLRVGGQMDILNASAEGELNGQWGWDDFLFTWRYGQECDFTNTCCGRTTYSGAEVGLEPVAADFTGLATPRATQSGDSDISFDLAIDEHRLGLQYGTIILFTLNEFVLPELTGQDNLACATESLFGCEDGGEFVCGGTNVGTCGCDRVGAWLSGALSSFVDLDPAMGTLACDMAVQGAAGFIEGQMQELAWYGTSDGYLSMSVDGTITDSDLDLKADSLVGTSTGTLNLGSVQTAYTSDVYADMVRVDCLSDADCGDTQACQVRRQILDDCTGRQVCAQHVGESLAGESCNRDNQCASGACMDSGVCFAACATDDDCSGGQTCIADFTVIQIDDTATLPVNACGVVE
jgi:hypothetical protein